MKKTSREIRSSGCKAIRGFRATQGLPVTGMIDPKLLQALGIKCKTAVIRAQRDRYLKTAHLYRVDKCAMPARSAVFITESQPRLFELLLSLIHQIASR
jgi:hypothetical protein